MKPKHIKKYLKYLTLVLSISLTLTTIACKSDNKDAGKTIVPEIITTPEAPDGPGINGSDGPNGGGSENGSNVLTVFKNKLGKVLTEEEMQSFEPDQSGLTICTDFDGDGLSNDREITTNKFVADYPRIVTRISTPVNMELRYKIKGEELVHGETLLEEDTKDTITNSMEDKQYKQLNEKTTPYVTKESYSNSVSHSESYGYDNEDESSTMRQREVSSSAGFASAQGQNKVAYTNQKSDRTRRSENGSLEDSISRSTMTEKTVFEDIDYIDNLDRNGIEFTEETVQTMGRNFRLNRKSIESSEIDENAGEVKAALYIKNLTLNMPVKVSNIRCTLSFRTHTGQYIPVETFRLRNEDWTMLEVDIAGGEEFGPYTIKIENLPTDLVKKALEFGYIPQIHVVSYDMHKVEDSNYDVGVNNLKIVEETAKERTAAIKISGSGIRELYRVAAFDVVKENGVEKISPGISLKKALFNIFRDRVGYGETFEQDSKGKPLTINDKNLKWKTYNSELEHIYTKETVENIKGNTWRLFETYIKKYTDEFDRVHYYETIKRIETHRKYNPFNVEDNPTYEQNQLLSEEEFNKMKYWVILHNGQYFEGDINDPIWPGERYEIICLDVEDFNNHYNMEKYYNNPFQTLDPVYLNTRWNKLSNDGEFARAIYLGKIVRDDIIKLDIDLVESRFLFDQDYYSSYNKTLRHKLIGKGAKVEENDTVNAWESNYFNYSFENYNKLPNGIPEEFTHSVIGGINTITVEITKSKNAHYYVIDFPQSGLGSVKVTEKYLEENNRKIIICRETKSIDKEKVGFITGDKAFQVKVTAHGNSYGTDVETQSAYNRSNVPIAEVLNPVDKDTDELVDPAKFSFSIEGLQNSMYVKIQETLNAEYYLIRYKGPLNYPENTEKTVLAQAGLNIIEDLYPPYEERLDDDTIKPGVYEVEVVAVNRKNVAPGLLVSLAEQFTNVHGNSDNAPKKYTNVYFKKFLSQRKYQSQVDNRFFQRNDLNDLEVNFNDGTGWHRLLTSSSYNAMGNKIKCWFSSYIDYKERKFHLEFKAPTGMEDEFSTGSNVFRGNKKEVDVYIRTASENRYRDTFWLKKSSHVSNEKGAPLTKILIDKEISSVNFIENWLNFKVGDNYLTDATELENTVHNNTFLSDGDNINNYFFAPLEYRMYRIKASRTNGEQFNPAEEYIEPPTFKVAELVEGSEDKIGLEVEITDIIINPNTTYIVYYKQFATDDGDSEEKAKANFLKDHNIYGNLKVRYLSDAPKYKVWKGDPDPNGDGDPTDSIDGERDDRTMWEITTVSGLSDLNRKIPIIPESTKAFKKNKPVAIIVESVSGSDEFSKYPAISGRFYLPVSTITPAKPEGVVITLDRDNSKCTINVDKINVPGEYLYHVDYKESSADDDSWDTIKVNSIDTTTGIPILNLEVSAEIENLKKGTFYDIRVYAVNSASEPGAYHEVKNYSTHKGWVSGELEQQRTLTYAQGYFKEDLSPLTNNIGVNLAGSVTNYSSIFDTQTEGDPENDKYLRIVSNGQNVVSATGLGLVPVFWNGLLPLPVETNVANNYLYIDLNKGKFLMPRPIYWSKCGSESDVRNPVLGIEYAPYVKTKINGNQSYVYKTNQNIVPEFNGSLTAVCRGINAGTVDTRDKALIDIKPFTSGITDLANGAASFWVQLYGTWRGKGNNNLSVSSEIRFYLTDNIFFRIASDGDGTLETVDTYVTLNDKNLISPQNEFGQIGNRLISGTDIERDTVHNITIAWDSSNNIHFLWDGKHKTILTETLINVRPRFEVEAWVRHQGTSNVYGVDGTGYASIDNIKIWNCKTTTATESNPHEDLAQMEFNGGAGNEGALHPIYTTTTFTPLLKGAGNGVGFYDFRDGQ